jgi:hypothetical protein
MEAKEEAAVEKPADIWWHGVRGDEVVEAEDRISVQVLA